MTEDPFLGVFETRVLVFLESSNYDGFRQVFLNADQFKRVSDAIFTRKTNDQRDLKDGMEMVEVCLSDEKYVAGFFDGMNSIEDAAVDV